MPAPVADSPKTRPHRTVTIEAVFGSGIQREVAMKILGEFLDAWKANVEASHKKNRVTVSIQKNTSR